MPRKRPIGKCHICGQLGPLSFEHVPPKAAFNDAPVNWVGFNQAINLSPDEEVKGEKHQRGAGAYTLCEKCNSDTGSWYADSFAQWCYQGMDILDRSGGKPSLIYFHHLFPLRIIKQIVVMFFSVNPDNFHIKHDELTRFVLNKEMQYLPPTYRFFIYYNTTDRFRFAGAVGVYDIHNHKLHFLSEISFPPFGYVMTIDSDPPDDQLVEITHFARYAYGEYARISLQLPVLPTYTVFPGDYREKEQIYQEAGIQHEAGE